MTVQEEFAGAMNLLHRIEEAITRHEHPREKPAQEVLVPVSRYDIACLAATLTAYEAQRKVNISLEHHLHRLIKAAEGGRHD